VLAVVGFASPAWGQEGDEPATEEEAPAEGEEPAEEPELSHEAEECIHTLEEGGEPEDCHEAPSPIFPAANELIWGAISFVVLFALLYKFGFPALRKGLDDRTERIRKDLDEAETAKTEAQQVKADYEAQLSGARQEATRLREDARSETEEYKTQRKAEIDAELADYRERARAEADAAKEQALAEVRSEVATLALAAAEQVVQKSLDDQTNRELVDRYIDQLQSQG
jgi:F-type H+-transporting ATPase subunit b